MLKRFLPLALVPLLFVHPAAASETTDVYVASPVTVDQTYPRVTSFGQDGIEVENNWPTTLTLARVSLKDKKLDQSYFNYTLEMQGINITGKAYPEMWLHFPDKKGFFFSRGLEHPLDKDSGWQTFSTPFILKAGEVPDEIVLNLHFDGVGKLRVRNVKLTNLQGASDKVPVEGAEKSAEEKPAAAEKTDAKPEAKPAEKTDEKPAETPEEKAEKAEDRD